MLTLYNVTNRRTSPVSAGKGLGDSCWGKTYLIPDSQGPVCCQAAQPTGCLHTPQHPLTSWVFVLNIPKVLMQSRLSRGLYVTSICCISSLFSNTFLVIPILLTPKRQLRGHEKAAANCLHRDVPRMTVSKLSPMDAHLRHKSLVVSSNPVSWIQALTGLFTEGSEP